MSAVSEPSDARAAMAAVTARVREAAQGAAGVAAIARRGVKVAPQGEELDVELHLACALDAPLPAVCAEVADAVRAAVARLTEAPIRTLTVRVDAVVPPPR